MESEETLDETKCIICQSKVQKEVIIHLKMHLLCPTTSILGLLNVGCSTKFVKWSKATLLFISLGDNNSKPGKYPKNS